ncbi:hypothetical protein [Spirosoma radiotolerans]|nr:hypothetical protein [Spirosoma radiotolerans]
MTHQQVIKVLIMDKNRTNEGHHKFENTRIAYKRVIRPALIGSFSQISLKDGWLLLLPMATDSNHFSITDRANRQIESRLTAYIKSVQLQHTKSPSTQYVTARLLKRLNSLR